MATSTYYNRIVRGNETTWQAMARNVTKLLYQYDLRKIIIACVKDEGENLNVTTTILKFRVNYEVLGMEESSKALVLVMHFLKHVNMGQH